MRFLVFGILLLVGFRAMAQTQSPSAPPETRDFDFWIGEWDVVTPDGKVGGHSEIESILNGRVIKESYQSAGSYKGQSFNIYNAAEERWEQYWVDNRGLALHLKGGLNAEGQMVLQGDRKNPKGETVTDRITWTDNKDGTVQQVWEGSEDGAETWNLVFNGHYRPKVETN